ncbi:PREDICTED: odorant receptor 43a-like [Dinoponera quadriceps]|uniref:Odorant receptor n=1 Tax=Dinoponera quadriceps TaxID=609295 RepID=A0A6P3Y4U6_DINQU|nr:PREDICTED: odorant receptor 43a-like [Dinoponera quadriceps]
MVGLWPPDNRDICKSIRPKFRLVYNFITLLFIATIPALASLIRVWGNMILMIDNLQYSLPTLMALFKISIIWYKQEALASLTDMIRNDWIKMKMEEERVVMLKCATITRALAICGVSILLGTFTSAFILPWFGLTTRQVTNLTDSGKPLLIQSYYFHDVSKSPQFELTLLAQGIVVLTGGVSYTAIDNFLGLLVLHVCGQLENLHSRLTQMEKYPNFIAVLKYNVQDHIRLIRGSYHCRSVQIIDDTFDLVLLGMIVCFGIMFCLQGFLIVNVAKQEGQFSFMQLIWFAAAILYTLLHMCLYCGVGEILVTQSERIHRATYEYAWYTVEPKIAKNLLLIMLRSDNSLHITAGKTFPMTMATLCNLLKTSAGYISVLLAKQE